VLVDGFTAGHWILTQERDSATLSVYPHRRLTGTETEAVTAEATRVLEFVAPGQGADASKVVLQQWHSGNATFGSPSR
jgi:hypothetical protein